VSTTTAEAAALFNHTAATGVRDLMLAFDIVVYLDLPLARHWDGIRAFYARALELIRDDIRFYVVDGRRKFKKVTPEAFEMLPFWGSSDAAERTVYGLTLQAGTKPDEASDTLFDFYSNGAYAPYVRLVLPASVGDEPDVAERVFDLVAPLRMTSGSAGYAASKRHDFYAANEGGPIYALSRRFRGVDFGTPQAFSKYAEHGLKSVNWITLLGTDLAERSGGVARLMKEARHGVTVRRLPHGVALQAGPRPLLGDVNHREPLTAYETVNALVARSRFPIESIGHHDGIGGEDNTRAWLARFDV